MKKIVIVGAGGFGREVEWLLERINTANGKVYELIGYADDGKEKGTIIGHSEVICNIDDLTSFKEEINVVIAIGNVKVRKEIANKLLTNEKILFPNIIDPDVIYNKEEVLLGKGNIIGAGTIMTVNIKLNDFNIINLDCTIGHDVILDDFITLYPSVNISGNVIINELTEIGTGTQVIQGLHITNNVIIGAGAVVPKSIEESGTYLGVPAKRIK